MSWFIDESHVSSTLSLWQNHADYFKITSTICIAIENCPLSMLVQVKFESVWYQIWWAFWSLCVDIWLYNLLFSPWLLTKCPLLISFQIICLSYDIYPSFLFSDLFLNFIMHAMQYCTWIEYLHSTNNTHVVNQWYCFKWSNKILVMHT